MLASIPARALLLTSLVTIGYFIGCDALITRDPTSLQRSYDFVCVGAGTAGAVIASRLSEDSSMSVLLIEAGLDDTGPGSDALHVPLFSGQAVGTVYDWNYTSTAQPYLYDRTIDYPRGFVLGGSSAINSMVYARGPSEDFDRLADVSGDEGWSWQNIRKYIWKHEQHVKAWDNRDETGQYDPAVHGRGPVLTSLPGTPRNLDYRVFNTTFERPEFDYNIDFNSGNGLGFGWMQTSVGNGVRFSSSTAYLSQARNRTNLDVLLNTQVSRLLPSDSAGKAFKRLEAINNGAFMALGPVSVFTEELERFCIYNDRQKRRCDLPLWAYGESLNRLVILSAGVFGTPQILLLSGIGPKKDIQDLGLRPYLDVPDIGQNLQDQPILSTQFSVSETTLGSVLSNATLMAEALDRYEANKTGIMASGILGNLGFLRFPDDFTREYGDSSPGHNSPHFTLCFIDLFNPNPSQTSPTDGNWISVTVQLTSPMSRGRLWLNSTSPSQHPIIDPAFLTHPYDIAAMKEGLKTLFRFISGPIWRQGGYLGDIFPDAQNISMNEAASEEYIRKFTGTISHPVGTASLGKVVQGDLKVKGIQGVRVVDASIFPFATSGFPQAQIYLIAERASDLIKEQNGIQ